MLLRLPTRRRVSLLHQRNDVHNPIWPFPVFQTGSQESVEAVSGVGRDCAGDKGKAGTAPQAGEAVPALDDYLAASWRSTNGRMPPFR